MFGGEVPDLEATPCGRCGERVDPADVVWDPWHQGDRQLAALPYHRACAGDVLPPAEPPAAGDPLRVCGICGRDLGPAFAPAFAALQARFARPEAPKAPPEVVWRLAGREPRRWAAEHFACLLRKVEASARERPLGGLPSVVINPEREGD